MRCRQRGASHTIDEGAIDTQLLLHCVYQVGAAIIAGTPVKCVVVKWFADQGYGFVRAANVEIFCHARSLRGAEALRQGANATADNREVAE